MARGSVGRSEASWGTSQITMYAKIGEQKRSEVVAKFILEGEKAVRTKDGRCILVVLNQICIDLEPTLFDALLKDFYIDQVIDVFSLETLVDIGKWCLRTSTDKLRFTLIRLLRDCCNLLCMHTPTEDSRCARNNVVGCARQVP